MARRPICGNDPRAQLTDQDKAEVARFREYLATEARAKAELPTLLAAAGTERWRVYVYDADQWMPIGMRCATRDEAVAKQRSFGERHDYAITRIVRETVSYQEDRT